MAMAEFRALSAEVDAVDAGAAAVPSPDLLRRLCSALRSPDPELRDHLAVYALIRWTALERRVSPAGMRELHLWAVGDEGILRDVGGPDPDAVFGRSFALVLLSGLLAVDNEVPFLGREAWERTRDAVVVYAAAELDVRSSIPVNGLIHTIAHLADVCDELAKSSLCDLSSARALLTALVEMVARRADVFTGEEDDRLSLCLYTLLTSTELGQHEVVAAIRDAAAGGDVARVNWKSTSRALTLRTAGPVDEVGVLAVELSSM